MIVEIIYSALIGMALYLLFTRGLPKGFPWWWALAFAASLFVGAFMPLGTFERFYYFIVLLSAFVVGSACGQYRYFWRVWIGVAVVLSVFVTADALRIIPSESGMLTSGEQFFGGMIRRPYALEHPNIVAGWSLLLPFGVWTLVTILMTQSRGALFGLVPVLVLRYVPRRYLAFSAGAGVLLLAVAIAIRPGTAFDRFAFWGEGLRFFEARPLMGWGSGSYRTSILSASADSDAMNAVVDGERTGMHTAHNALITIAAENGLMGVIPFVGFAVSLFRAGYRSSHPMKWGVMAFAIQQFFDDQWFHPITAILLGVALSFFFFPTLALPTETSTS